MKKSNKEISDIIWGMRTAYFKGENSMEWCRKVLRRKTGISKHNEILAILVAYDLQAGSYVASAKKNLDLNRRWCQQIGSLVAPALGRGGSILEVGVGEATTLAGVMKQPGINVSFALGLDISWSRLFVGKKWLQNKGCKADLFVADLLNIPLADNSVDVVYSSHSLEPNRGKEEAAIAECLRIARRAVILVEPIYELASPVAKLRMRKHGYVEGLKKTAEHLGAQVKDYRLLEYSPNPLNPSGVLHLQKKKKLSEKINSTKALKWRCPITGVELNPRGECFYVPKLGIAYPVFYGIPLLGAEHLIVASKLGSSPNK